MARDNLIVTPDMVMPMNPLYARKGALFVPKNLMPSPVEPRISRQQRRHVIRRLNAFADHQKKAESAQHRARRLEQQVESAQHRARRLEQQVADAIREPITDAIREPITEAQYFTTTKLQG